jgi:membrane protein
MPATDVRTALTQQRQARQQSSWWGILKNSASEWSDADAMTWAAAIACYAVLALAPLLVVAVKVGAVLLRGQANAVSAINNDVLKIMGSSDGAGAITAILDKVVNQKGGLLASMISSVLVIVSVGGVFSEVQQAMNRVWKLKPRPGQAMIAFIRARLMSVVVLGLAAVVLLASLFVAGWLDKHTEQFGAGAKVLAWGIDLVATLIALTLILAMVFRTVPDAEIEWRTTVVGAIITAVLFAAGKYGLTLYFKYGTPTSAFGAVGSLAAILIWIYYSAQIVLFGAVFTQVYAKQRGHGVTPSKHAQFLSECNETETATPSPESPAQKPARPSARDRDGKSMADYGAVLGRIANSRGVAAARNNGAPTPRPVAARDLLAAGAGLAVGALIGRYSALQARHPSVPSPEVAADLRLRRRLDAVQEKVRHASRMKTFLEQDDVNERLEVIQSQIRNAAHKHKLPSRRAVRPNWTQRLVQSVTRHF